MKVGPGTQKVKGNQYPSTPLDPPQKGKVMDWFKVVVLLGGLMLGGTLMDQCRYKDLEARNLQQDDAIEDMQKEQQTVEIDNARVLSRIEESLAWIKEELKELKRGR